MNRKQLQTVAKTRLKDAKALLGRKRWAAAYYLAGYAIECGLKSCILRNIEETGIIFSDRKYLKELGDCWTHDLEALLKLAGLVADFGTAHSANPTLKGNWTTVQAWKETSRYEDKAEAEARTLYNAITAEPDGVFQWIRSRW